MSEADPRWKEFPILQIFFEQWRDNRAGAAADDFQRPFSRNWERLLQEGGLVTAEDRRAADRDVRTVAESGLLEIRTRRYRSYEIERVLLPNDALPRWRELFASELPDSQPAMSLAKTQWEPELSFLVESAPAIAAEDLLKLNEFFAAGGRDRPIVPIKERSLQIFGDEKRLDSLLSTSLFRLDRLTASSLRCEIVSEPLGWRRGPTASGPVLVVENAATWHSYSRWNQERGGFSGVVYGGGNRFIDGALFLQEIFREIGGVRRILYFGDLDPQGLRIPCRASDRTFASGLPPVKPDLWSYRKLLAAGIGSKLEEGGSFSIGTEELAWLGPLSEPARELFERRERIAQEHLGWEFLLEQGEWREEVL